MTFEDAIREVKAGWKVRRKCWASGQYLFMGVFTTKIILERSSRTTYYRPSPEHMVAEDWEVIETP